MEGEIGEIVSSVIMGIGKNVYTVHCKGGNYIFALCSSNKMERVLVKIL